MKKFLIYRSFVMLLTAIVVVSGCQSGKVKEELAESGDLEEMNVESVDPGIYELRTYYAADGKLENLLSRFRDHTVSLFEKHGMENIAYWVPVENDENLLIYLLRFPDKASRDASWNSFRDDPDWIAAKEASQVDGDLVDSVKSQFLRLSDFSPSIEITNKEPRAFELRTYYCNEGKLTDLHTRFREHTMEIFENHGMSNVAYFDFETGVPESENTLLYFISHTSTEAANQNWKEFIDDPEWQSVYAASIENGKLVDSLTSVFLQTVDFSPLK